MKKSDMRLDNLATAYQELEKTGNKSDRIIMDMIEDLKRDILLESDSIPDTTAEQIYSLAYERLMEIRKW